jgi:hypothetical protein
MKWVIVFLTLCIFALVGYIVHLKQVTVAKTQLQFVQKLSDFRNTSFGRNELTKESTFSTSLSAIQELIENSIDIASYLYNTSGTPQKVLVPTANRYHKNYLKTKPYYQSPTPG